MHKVIWESNEWTNVSVSEIVLWKVHLLGLVVLFVIIPVLEVRDRLDPSQQTTSLWKQRTLNALSIGHELSNMNISHEDFYQWLDNYKLCLLFVFQFCWNRNLIYSCGSWYLCMFYLTNQYIHKNAFLFFIKFILFKKERAAIYLILWRNDSYSPSSSFYMYAHRYIYVTDVYFIRNPRFKLGWSRWVRLARPARSADLSCRKRIYSLDKLFLSNWVTIMNFCKS